MRSSLLTPVPSPRHNKMILVPFSEQPCGKRFPSYNQTVSPEPEPLCYFDASPRGQAIPATGLFTHWYPLGVPPSP